MAKEIWVDCTKQNLEEAAKLYGATGILGKSKFGSKVLLNYIDVHLESNKDIGEKLKPYVGKFPYIIASSKDWSVIPAENLVAAVSKDSGSKILMRTNNFDEAKAFLTALELGVDGLYVDDGSKLETICSLLSPVPGMVRLVDVEVKDVKVGEMGDRVCVDFTTYLNPREGILVGSNSNFLFLANSETEENPWVEPRPFRVNAGYLHSYVLSGHKKTRYLSELAAGQTLPIVNYDGETRIGQIGRVKIEKRLAVQIEAEYKGLRSRTFSQYAETVKLVSPKGVIPVKGIKPGDIVKAMVDESEGGMHFGTFVKSMSSREK